MAIPIPLIASGLAALGIGGAQQATENLSSDQKLELLKKAGQLATGTSGIMAMKDNLPEKKNEEEEEEKKPEPDPDIDLPDIPKKDEEEEESLKPNETFFKQLSGVKNHNVERDPNDLFQEGWQDSFFAQPKALGKLGDYTVVIDQMKRSDNNFLLVKDGEIFGNIEVSAPVGKGQEKTIELDAIGVPKEKQGKGIAKDILRNLFSLADANDITIQGSAQPFGNKTLNKKQLVEFYKSMGFEGDANNLVRKPVKLEEKANGGFIDKPLYDTKKDIF